MDARHWAPVALMLLAGLMACQAMAMGASARRTNSPLARPALRQSPWFDCTVAVLLAVLAVATW